MSAAPRGRTRTLAEQIQEIADRVDSAVGDIEDAMDDLEALATAIGEQPAVTEPATATLMASCLFCGERFAHEVGHACADMRTGKAVAP